MAMTTDPATWPMAAAALLGVLGLIALLAQGARRLGIGGSVDRRQRGRRLALVEVLALDARRRLVLLRCDGREALLLTGGGQDLVLGWLPEPAGERRE